MATLRLWLVVNVIGHFVMLLFFCRRLDYGVWLYDRRWRKKEKRFDYNVVSTEKMPHSEWVGWIIWFDWLTAEFSFAISNHCYFSGFLLSEKFRESSLSHFKINRFNSSSSSSSSECWNSPVNETSLNETSCIKDASLIWLSSLAAVSKN